MALVQVCFDEIFVSLRSQNIVLLKVTAIIKTMTNQCLSKFKFNVDEIGQNIDIERILELVPVHLNLYQKKVTEKLRSHKFLPFFLVLYERSSTSPF